MEENGNKSGLSKEERNCFEVVRKRDEELFAVKLDVMIKNLGGSRVEASRDESGYLHTVEIASSGLSD